MKKMRYLAATTCAMALIGTGASFLLAQSPPSPQPSPGRPALARLRAEVIRLRTEVEMLRFDYELARDVLLEDLKTRRSLQMIGPMMQLGGAIQSAINAAGTNPPDEAPKKKSQDDVKKKQAEEAKKAEDDEKKEEAEEAAFIVERKKKLATIFASLAEKRLDLEDAERRYNDLVR